MGTTGSSLDINQDKTFQRREWRVQRVGWLLIAAFLLAALLGVFGSGPLSSATASSDNKTIQVDYDRVLHNQTDDFLTLTLSEDAIENGTVTVEFNRSWLEAVEISNISPQPTTQYATSNGMAMELNVLDRGEIMITVSLRAQAYGMIEGRVDVAQDSASFSQFVLP